MASSPFDRLKHVGIQVTGRLYAGKSSLLLSVPLPFRLLPRKNGGATIRT